MMKKEMSETARGGRKWIDFALVALTILLGCWWASASAQEKRLKLEELIARHLEAIGKAEALASVRKRVVSGKVRSASQVGGTGEITGEGMMVSAGPKMRYGMNFPFVDYPGEDLVFDGSRAVTGTLPQGTRSPLGQFLYQQSLPLKEGLIGGVLSTAWPLLHIAERQPRLELRGLKKIEGQELYEVGYRPRKGSTDLKVFLYFDPTTFRHVRSQYSLEIGATLGTLANEIPRQEESYFRLTEEFDDFREVDGLMLPHRYKMRMNIMQMTAVGSSPNRVHDWILEVSRISHKENFSEDVFTIK
jgi:hypothetical protein